MSFKLGFTDSGFVHTPRLVLDEFDSPIQNVIQVCFGNVHMCILTDSHLYVCGSNSGGQLGMPDVKMIDRPRIHEQFVGQNITDIATSDFSSYVVANKICYATGANNAGQLGIPTDRPINTFIPISLFTPVFVRSIESVQVRAGYRSTGLIII
jgi:alpha-tubulin suppressor-like RCC1 family protein